MQGILPLTPLGALPQTPHSPCGRGISYCFFPLGKCYASLRQGRVVFSPTEKISTLCLDCVLALSALKNLFRCLFIEQPTELSDHLFSCVLVNVRTLDRSLPSRERGLKSAIGMKYIKLGLRRSLRGSMSGKGS